MRHTYMKPSAEVVTLRFSEQLLAGSTLVSPKSTTTNLDTEDNIGIEDSPKSDWGR